MTDPGHTLQQIAEHIGARLVGNPNQRVRAPAPLALAGPNDISFAEAAGLADNVRAGMAGAVVVGQDFPDMPERNLLRVAQPRAAFLRLLELYAPRRAVTGIHPRAVIGASADLGEEVSVGPCAVVGEDARIGPRTRIDAGAVIGAKVSVGADCEIGPNVTLLEGVRIGDRCIIHAGAVIGGDGFGFQWLEDHHHKIPQLGTVVIEDDVEVGCNTCIDRATLGETRVGCGTKIDNQVHIGHNDHIGRHVILVAQVGVSGSVEIGDGAILAGQVGVSDHVEIGERAQVGAAAGVTRNIKPGETVWGMPARPMRRVLREQAALGRLPEALKELKAHAARLETLEGGRGEDTARRGDDSADEEESR